MVLKGINPYAGLLHHEEDKVLPFLTFDFMEGFRHTFVDKSVLNLISRKTLRKDRHSKVFKDGIYINKHGMKVLYREFSKKIDKLGKELNKETLYFIKTVSS